MSRFFPGPSSAASAASSPPRLEHDWEQTTDLSMQPPTLSQLKALTAVPVGLVGRRANSTKRGKSTPLAKDGQIVAKMYDAFGTRPYPTNGISLNQTIQIEMTSVLTTNWLVSSATAGLPTYASAYFAISSLPGASTLLSVFDQYRIDQIEFWTEFQAPNGTLAFPDLITAIDLDDANTPTSLGQVQDHQGAVVGVGPGGHYHRFRPHMAVAAFSGAFTSYSNQKADWIDAASPNVQHYGLKGVTVSNGGSFAINLVARVVVSFRSPAIN